MFDYPYTATRDGDGWLITFPDLPEAITDAETEVDIPTRARDVLWTVLDHYVHQRRELPAATTGQSFGRVYLPTIANMKLMLHQGLVWNGITQAELARRLETSPTLVNRLLDLDHASKADEIDRALSAINVRRVIKFDPRSAIPPRARPVQAGFSYPEGADLVRLLVKRTPVTSQRVTAAGRGFSGAKKR